MENTESIDTAMTVINIIVATSEGEWRMMKVGTAGEADIAIVDTPILPRTPDLHHLAGDDPLLRTAGDNHPLHEAEVDHYPRAEKPARPPVTTTADLHRYSDLVRHIDQQLRTTILNLASPGTTSLVADRIPPPRNHLPENQEKTTEQPDLPPCKERPPNLTRTAESV